MKTNEQKLPNTHAVTDAEYIPDDPLSLQTITIPTSPTTEHPLPHIINLSKKLIAIRSTKDNLSAVHEALDIIKQELQAYYPIEEFEHNGLKSILVHNTHQKTRHFKIILNAHIDVVPAKDEQFYPYEENGKLYGRGSYDMKAATAVMVTLFKRIAQKISYPIALQIATDEESLGINSTKYHLDQGLRADFVISGENSGLHIKNQAKGLLWIKLHAKGKSAHGAYLWRGENALWKLQEALHSIKQRFPIPKQEVWETTVNLSKIETPNLVFNNVPDHASALLDIRFVPQDKDTILQTIKNAISSDIEIEVLANDLPQYTAADNIYLKTLQQSVEDITTQKSELISSHAPSDIRHYNFIDVNGVEFGPNGANQHGENEWVDINSLEQYYFILKEFLSQAAQL